MIIQPACSLSSPVTEFFIIAGATAVGKSDLAGAVAEHCGGEIVSADAFQIYRGLDLLTAKPSAELLARAPHHLIGEIPLTRSFDVAQYLVAAREHIVEIRARGKVPIITGGTGLYLRALTHGLAEMPRADASIRAELEKQPLAELQRQLAQLDPVGAAQIDLKNPRRVIRAIEVCHLTGLPFSSFRQEWAATPTGIRGIVLTMNREALNARIDRRTETMFAAGVVEEVRSSGEIGFTASQTIGLREIRALLAGQLSQPDCIATIQQTTRRYAKRQMTWFRREPALESVDLSQTADLGRLAESLAQRAAQSMP